MHERVKKLLSDDICELILENQMTSEQRYELIFHLLYETDEEIIPAINEMIKDGFPVETKKYDLLYFIRKMNVEIILMTYGIHYDNLNIQKLLTL